MATRRCTLCGEEEQLGDKEDMKHLALYVIGSEGIEACLQCRIILTNVARGIRERCGNARHRLMIENRKRR